MPNTFPATSEVPPSGHVSTDARLSQLFAGVLPVWARHLASSRAQSEVAVGEMLKAFADIGPHINLAELQARQITQALSQADGGITRLTQACERALAPVLANPATPAAASAAIAEVLHMVHSAVDALEDIAKPFSQQTQMVAEHVERMYMGFQYQDKTSQMMSLLEGDIANMQVALASTEGEVPSLAEWLARLESQYAMQEQRQSHTGQDASGATGEENGTTFF